MLLVCIVNVLIDVLHLNFIFLSQFVFVYQRGMNTGGDVALDDITILPGGCFSEPPIDPPDDNNGNLKPSSATSTEQTVIL